MFIDVYVPQCVTANKLGIPRHFPQNLSLKAADVPNIWPVGDSQLMLRFPAAAKSLNTAATLFAGPGKASNSTASVSVCIFCLPLILDTNKILTKLILSPGKCFVPSPR